MCVWGGGTGLKGRCQGNSVISISGSKKDDVHRVIFVVGIVVLKAPLKLSTNRTYRISAFDSGLELAIVLVLLHSRFVLRV